MYSRTVLCFIILFNGLELYHTSFLNADNHDPVVVLTNPKGSLVQGHILKTDLGHDIFTYQDIPYAEPPIGPRRFQRSVLSHGWKGTMKATQNRKICLQSRASYGGHRNFTEDCLVLNIYSPTKPNSGEKYPVMIWIHGGGFFCGSGIYDDFHPKYFIDEKILMVTINYRLGALGFLSTGDHVIPPNNGLHDQILAFQWVHENIEAFGGNPNNVVIAGESAGAVSVSYQLIGTKPSKYFTGAIMSSGSALCPFGYSVNVHQGAVQYSRAIEPTFKSDNSSSIHNFLMHATSDQLLDAIDKCSYFFAPTAESGADHFGEAPYEAFAQGRTKRIPILAGFNSEEYFTFFRNMDDIIKRASERDRNCFMDPKFNIKPENRQHACLALKQLYTKDTFINDLPSFIRFTTDEQFVRSILTSVHSFSKYVPETYLYQLAYNPTMAPKCPVHGIDGVGHGADLFLLFDQYGASHRFTETDRLISKRMVRIWANFIKYRNPTPGPEPILENIKWPQVKPDKMQYLNLTTKMTFSTNPRKGDRWAATIDHFFQHPITIY